MANGSSALLLRHELRFHLMNDDQDIDCISRSYPPPTSAQTPVGGVGLFCPRYSSPLRPSTSSCRETCHKGRRSSHKAQHTLCAEGSETLLHQCPVPTILHHHLQFIDRRNNPMGRLVHLKRRRPVKLGGGERAIIPDCMISRHDCGML